MQNVIGLPIVKAEKYGRKLWQNKKTDRPVGFSVSLCIFATGRHPDREYGHWRKNEIQRIEITLKTIEVWNEWTVIFCCWQPRCAFYRKYSINSLVYWVTYVHNVVYSFYRSMIYCYINSTQRCAGSIVIDIIPTNGADKRKFFPFAPYFPVTNVIKRYFYPYFPAIIGIKGYSFPYFPYLSGIMKIKTALYSLFSRLDWHKTVVFPCLGEIYEGIRSLSWEIPVT